MLKTIDLFIIAGYLIILLYIGYASSKSSKNSNEYLVANRQMSWLPIALSVAATTISANGFIGGPGWAYDVGMQVFMINIAVPFGCFITLWLTSPIVYHLKIISIYEYVDLRFGKKTKLFLVVHFFINSIIQVSSMVFIPSLFLSVITGWSLSSVVPIIVLFSIIYTAIGGIRAVIWTDVLQMIVVWGSVLLILYLLFNSLDMSVMEFFKEARASGKLNTLNFSFSFKEKYTVLGTLLGGSILWTRYFAFDQVQVQRVITANSLKSVKKSLLSSAIIMNVVYFFILFLGILLFFFYEGKEFNNLNNIMIDFILNNIPTGFLGLTVVGIFASVMSSVDSILNSVTAIFIKDVYEVYLKKDKTIETKKIVGVVSSGIFGIFIIIFIILGFRDSVRSILDLVGAYISVLVGPACAIFVLGLICSKVSDNGASFGLLIGLIAGIVGFKSFDIDWIWNPAIGFLITILSSLIYSIFCPENKKECIAYTFRGIKKSYKNIDKKDLPGCFDIYSVSILIFFIAQYCFLYFLMN